MSNQKPITSFFSRNSGTPSKFSFETVNDGLKKICPYCSGSFYALGFIQHLTHPEGAKKYKMPTTGIVKVRGDSYQKAGDPSPFIDTSNEEDNDSLFSYDSEDSDDSEVIEEETSFSPDLPTKRKSPGAFGRRLTIVQKVDAFIKAVSTLTNYTTLSLPSQDLFYSTFHYFETAYVCKRTPDSCKSFGTRSTRPIGPLHHQSTC